MTADHDDQEIARLSDALDHIANIAGSARKPTRRLDWIMARARMALRGEPWQRDYLPEPRKQVDEDVRTLRAALRSILEAYDARDNAALAAAIGETKARFPSLAKKLRRG